MSFTTRDGAGKAEAAGPAYHAKTRPGDRSERCTKPFQIAMARVASALGGPIGAEDARDLHRVMRHDKRTQGDAIGIDVQDPNPSSGFNTGMLANMPLHK